MLVYYEIFGEMSVAINREKQIKAGSRKKKLALIESMNLDWKDLYDEIAWTSLRAQARPFRGKANAQERPFRGNILPKLDFLEFLIVTWLA